MKLFIKRLLLLTIPFALVIPLTNYVVDPGSNFKSDEYIKGIVDIMLKGHNVRNISNIDERILIRDILQNTKQAPDMLVLGASKILEFGQDSYPDTNFKVRNCAVTHGNIHDILAIAGLADSLKILPKYMVINVDALLLPAQTPNEWQSIEEYHDYMVNKLFVDEPKPDIKKDRFRKLAPLFSIEYFKSSVGRGLKKQPDVVDIGTQLPNPGTFADGTVSYPDYYMHPDTNTVAIEAKNTAKFQGIKPPDGVNIKLFNKLLAYLQSKKVNIKLVMIPYHPSFYVEIEHSSGYRFTALKTVFTNIANQHHIQIVGDFNPQKYNIHESDFYDIYHCSRQSVRKVLLSKI